VGLKNQCSFLKESLIDARENGIPMDEKGIWLDDMDLVLETLKESTQCGRIHSQAEELAEDIEQQILNFVEDDKKDRCMLPESESNNIIDEIDRLIQRTEKRIARLEKKIGPYRKDEPNTLMGQPNRTRYMGIVALLPIMYSNLASTLELDLISLGFGVLGAFVSILYFIELGVVFKTRPIWVYNKRVAGSIIHKFVTSDFWSLLFVIPIALILSQGIVFCNGFMSLVAKIGWITPSIATSIVGSV
ncbi:MAG: hypothetical protein ACOC3C_06530, partial [Candidatus Thorarchaeota archaeon]